MRLPSRPTAPGHRAPAAAVVVSVAAALAAAPSAGAARAPSTYERSGPTGRLVVTMKGGVATPRGAGNTVAGVRAVSADPGSRSVVVDGGDAAARARVTARLEADPAVASVAPELRAALRAPNDPVLRLRDPLAPPGVPYAWWASAMGLQDAWKVANGRDVTIAVIDSGVDASHPQLSSVVRSSTTTGSVTGTSRTDEVGHGTHVSSLACSAYNDGLGTIGAGGRCRLIAIKSDLTDSAVTKAIGVAVDRGADAIVMSFGTNPGTVAPDAMVRALRSAARKGVVAVAAAADKPDTDQGYPSNVLQPTGTGPRMTEGIGLDVTAAQRDGRRASFAGRGSQISLAAYGTYGPGGPPGLLGAYPPPTVAYDATTTGADGTTSSPIAQRTTLGGSDLYAYEQGTSMAAPLVAGVAGLVRDVNPDLTAQDITTILKRTATRKGGWNPDLGWGIVNADRAVEAGRRLDRHAPRATLRSRSRTVTSGRIRISWRATDRGPRPTIASGLRRVEVYRSVDRGRFRRVGRASGRSLTVSVPAGSSSRFAVVAVDREGNRQRLTSRGAITLRR